MKDKLSIKTKEYDDAIKDNRIIEDNLDYDYMYKLEQFPSIIDDEDSKKNYSYINTMKKKER